MIKALTKGDLIVTSAGIHGRITAVESDAVFVEIAPNTRIKIDPSHVARKLDPAADSKAKKAANGE
jgi:preprotein translocase subunit YajC